MKEQIKKWDIVLWIQEITKNKANYLKKKHAK